jgi:dihydroorotate dehydrogenase
MSKINSSVIRPALFSLPAETAHNFGIEALRVGLSSNFARKLISAKFDVSSFGVLNRFGLEFRNPIGIAAGFDKNGKVVNQLAAIGFGHVEVGTVTFEPQEGNSKPRMFRLPEDNALINRLGFNNEGAVAIARRLEKLDPTCVLGVNIGKNKDVPNDAAIENYLASFELVFEAADYVAVNVSSPNTPNLRELQKSDELESLLSALQSKNAELSESGKRKPLFVKIAPDLADDEIKAIVDICQKLELSGIIATNTTINRENLKTDSSKLEEIGNGGLSGKPLANRSNEIIKTIYRHSKGELPVIGVGGIFSAEDAFGKIISGASLLQAYTGFVYHGITFARDINVGLKRILDEKGFNNLDEAIGSEVNL